MRGDDPFRRERLSTFALRASELSSMVLERLDRGLALIHLGVVFWPGFAGNPEVLFQ